MLTRKSVQLALHFALFSLVLATCWAGVRGSFVFDDFANLPALGATGPVTDGASFWRYVTSGTADPLGRPLVLLSFLADAHNWPADPLPFKRTNLLLHAFTSLLLVQLLRQLGRELWGERVSAERLEFAAFLGAAFWALHPLWISTTLYVVQREAMLPTLFTVCGLLLWLHGRQALFRGEVRNGLLWLSLGLGGCTLLAALSKANGVLLPALALTIELCLGKVRPPSKCVRPANTTYRLAMWTLAGFPSALVGGYLLYQGWYGFAHGISNTRPWTLGERLLTEPRVLVDYLDLLWLPRPFTPGLFNDGIVVSTSLWSPWSTAPCILAVLILVAGAYGARRRLPAIALSILFFFTGHLVESTTIPLELYFEHRNYLPALLMFWPLALWLCGISSKPGKADLPAVRSWRISKAALGLVLIAGLVCMTHARAALWGNTRDQALLWAQLNPRSPRAQVNAAQVEIKTGFPERAVRRLEPALQRSPKELQIALNLVAAECELGKLPPPTRQAANLALRTTKNPGALLTSWFDRAIDRSAKPPCPQFDFALVKELLDSAAANPVLDSQSSSRQDLLYLQGRLQLTMKHPDVALMYFNIALDQQVRATVAFQQAAYLGSAGYPAEALVHLAHYEGERDKEMQPPFGMPIIHAWVLDRQHYWDKELSRLRSTLRDDEKAQSTSSR